MTMNGKTEVGSQKEKRKTPAETVAHDPTIQSANDPDATHIPGKSSNASLLSREYSTAAQTCDASSV